MKQIVIDGNVYSFRNFEVVNSFGDFIPTRHQKRINLVLETKIVRVSNQKIPRTFYSFDDLNEILTPTYGQNYLVCKHPAQILGIDYFVVIDLLNI